MAKLDEIVQKVKTASIKAVEKANQRGASSESDPAEVLREQVKSKLGVSKLVLASNREPYIHFYNDDRIEYFRYASGLTIALDSVARATNGSWVVYGSGAADREAADASGRVAVPPDNPCYTLRRIFLSKKLENDYYNGFSNQVLWPLCHVVFTRPNFDLKFWEAYQEVNRLFAQAIVDEAAEDNALVFLQDYHLALCAKYIKELKPSFTTVLFWHIPWPNPEIFRICPWKQEILDGLLANDILGFHLRFHADNFLKTVALELEAKIDNEKDLVLKAEKKCQVRAYPISVDFKRIDKEASSPEIQLGIEKIRRKYGLSNTTCIGLGVDRIDYSKGIPERLRALDRFFELNPQQQGKLVFIQVGVPSRTSLEVYQNTIDQVENMIQAINWKYSDGRWNPIIYIKEHQDFTQIIPFYRLADFCVVSSLHDGMNLVAKEYVSAQVDGNGVLILSQFTGSARELESALLINPYDTETFAQTIKQAVEMPLDQKVARMHRLKEIVSEHTIYDWAEEIVGDLARIRQ